MNLNFMLSQGQFRDLREIKWPGKLRLLVMAPHPDDFDAIGETLKHFYDAGHDIHVVVAETGSGVEDTYAGGLSQLEKRKLRNQEQRESLRFFGLPEENLHLLALHNADDDQVSENEANLEPLKRFIVDLKPQFIFLPHGNDTNRAHRAMHALVKKITQDLSWQTALMLNQDIKTISIKPDIYFPFDEEEAKWKAHLLRFHDSQQQRNLNMRGHGFDERILNLNRSIARALAIELPYASAFEVEIAGSPQ